MVDTLKIYERLKDVKIEEPAAKEIAEIFKETTQDLLVTKKILKKRFPGLKLK